ARSSLAIFDRIFEFIDSPADSTLESDSEASEVLDAEGTVVVDDVVFTYGQKNGGGDRVSSVGGVTMRIEAGSFVGLVGPSGSGKTTLAHLIAGLYRPSRGSVTVDGLEISLVAPHLRAQLVTLASQDVFLFHDSALENLLFAPPEASVEDVVRAAKAAQIHDHLSALPHGYDTVLGERGYALSSGERQRLALARVLLR